MRFRGPCPSAKVLAVLGLGAIVAAGCFRTLDPLRMKCQPTDPTGCPRGYACMPAEGDSWRCAKVVDAAAVGGTDEVGGSLTVMEAGAGLGGASADLGGFGFAEAGAVVDGGHACQDGAGAGDGKGGAFTSDASDIPLGGGGGFFGSGGAGDARATGGAGGSGGPSGGSAGTTVPPSGLGGASSGTGGLGTGGALASGELGAGGVGEGIGTGGVGVTATGGTIRAGGTSGTGGRSGSGGAVASGGSRGIGGASGSGGFSGPGGATACAPACPSDSDCVRGACVPVPGNACASADQCSPYASCCDGSDQSCDGTRLPTGDGTNAGQLEVSQDKLTVADKVTGLIWQRDGLGSRASACANGTTCTWNEAKDYCNSLTLAGLTGWRLPSALELASIVDLMQFDPDIDPTAFPSTPPEMFWTSSPYVPPSNMAYFVDFDYGWLSRDQTGSLFRARCVRGLRCYPTTRFLAREDGLVLDTLTRLLWQQQVSKTTMKWQDAASYCDSMGLRLPTVRELRSILNLTVASGAKIDQTAFPSTPADWFWTSAGGPSSPWFVLFSNGYSFSSPDLDLAWVRCVR